MRRLLLACLLVAATAARAEIKDRIAAVVNGQPIVLSEVEERVTPELVRIAARPDSPARDEERRDLLRRTLEQLIDEKLVEAEASQFGLDVTEDELQGLVDRLAKQNGMDLQQFREAVAQQGIEYDTLRESLRRQQLVLRLLQMKVKPRKVSDEEVQAAYAGMAADTDVEVRARHIFIASPDHLPTSRQGAAAAKAEEVLRRLRQGDSFAKVARDLSEGPTAREGGDLGYFKRGQMAPALDQAAFSLKPGQTSGLIRSNGDRGGYHLIYVEDRRKLPQKPLAEVQEEIRARLANDSIFKEREHYLAQLRKAAQIDQKL